MLGLADRVTALASRSETRYSADTWLSDYLIPAMEQFTYGGNTYGLNMTHRGVQIHEIVSTLPGYAMALRACPPAFAAQLVRAFVISQTRFTFRNRLSSGKPRRTFGTSALQLLERPWANATTGELVSRMEWHAGLAGNSYVTNRTRGRLRVLRPDWVAIVYGSQQEPEQAAYALDGEVIGYVYAIGGLASTGEALAPMGGGRMYTLLPEEVAHWSPIPDPEASGIGMSWLTPAVRDIQADRAATEHKLRFFSNGATPNLVVKGLQATTREKFLEIVEMLEERHSGVANAFKTLYLTAGADATVVGSNFRDMDLKNIQGASETRISALSRVPASLLGIAEGLAGSSLNAGNFGMARRIFADTWVYPSLQDLAAALAPLVRVPADADLWFDAADIPLLREDGKDAAEIEDIKATTITKYVREGFTAESSIAAVAAQDISLLKHTGNVSVQLQPPGTTANPPAAGPPAIEGPPGKEPPPTGGTRDGDPDELDDFDEDIEALLVALAEFAGELGDDERAWTPAQAAKHARYPKGHPKAGKFRPMVDRIIEALTAHVNSGGKGDPFAAFDREQLRKVAVKRGITLKPGVSRDDIAKALIADLTPAAPTPPHKATPSAPKTAPLPPSAMPVHGFTSIGLTATQVTPKKGLFSTANQSQAIHVKGVSIGTIHDFGSSGWQPEMPSGATPPPLPWPSSGKKSRTQAIQELVNAMTKPPAPGAASPGKAGATKTTPAAAAPSAPVALDAEVKNALDVLYGIDPKAKTAARQLDAYGALRRSQFEQLGPAEQSTLLGDLVFIAANSKGPNAAEAVRLVSRFTPPGTTSGSVPKQAIHLPPNVVATQTRVADPAGTPGLLTLKPKQQRGKSGDGWTQTASGTRGPWGKYGAAGLMLRHVGADGKERFLMVQRGPAISDPGKWQFPGGAKEEKETFFEGAAREVVEELGFKESDLDGARVHGTHTNEVPTVTVPGLKGSTVPWGYVSIAATVPKQLMPDLSTSHARAETSDAKWMTREEIRALDTKGKLLKPLTGGALETNVMSLFPASGAAPSGTMRPPRLTGMPTVTQKATFKPSLATDLASDKASINKLRQEVKQARSRYAGKVADDRLATIGAMQGFDRMPTVVPKSEMDRLLKTGDYIEAWRGVKGSSGSGWSAPTRGGAVSKTKTAGQINEDFRSGIAYYGKGVYGNGYYFATERSIAANYSDGTRGSLVRVLIPKTAKIAEFGQMKTETKKASSAQSKAKSSYEDGTLYDEGRYAAARGYDVIQVNHRDLSKNMISSTHVTRPGKPTYTVLNRSILIVEEA